MLKVIQQDLWIKINLFYIRQYRDKDRQGAQYCYKNLLPEPAKIINKMIIITFWTIEGNMYNLFTIYEIYLKYLTFRFLRY